MKPAQMVAMILTVLLVLYPLSPGPVGLYYMRIKPKHIVPKAVDTFYAPLEWLCEHSQTIKDAYDWYFHLWGVR